MITLISRSLGVELYDFLFFQNGGHVSYLQFQYIAKTGNDIIRDMVRCDRHDGNSRFH